MYSKETSVINQTGLHARPASVFVNEAKKFGSSVQIRNVTEDHPPVNAKSIIRLLSEGMGMGTRVEIIADGPDEQLAVDTLTALIDSGFGE